MVRLKAPNLSIDDVFLIAFQFQNGTIKRKMEAKDRVKFYAFQFQNGTIKR